METYYEALNLWKDFEDDYEINPLPKNFTIAQIKSHKKKKVAKSKLKGICLLMFPTSSNYFHKNCASRITKRTMRLSKERVGDERTWEI